MVFLFFEGIDLQFQGGRLDAAIYQLKMQPGEKIIHALPQEFTVDGETDLDHLVQYFQQFDSMAECKLAEDALGGLLLVTFISLGLLTLR